MHKAAVIGAGLAGCEAAWQLAREGLDVELFEMKPEKMTPAHHSKSFAELVCSNSLRSDRLENAVGLLKEELRRFDSLIMKCADATRVEAGGALAVDREGFSQMVTEKIRSNPKITVTECEITSIPLHEGVIIASGPLTSDALAKAVLEYFGGEGFLSFYDAAAPIVSFESVDMESAFFASRYGRGTADYINCPLTREEYLAFWHELSSARQAEVHGFEDDKVFEGCMPVEVLARRGEDTLRYGPMKPVGLRDPRTGAQSYAVLQLRRDNAQGSLYNLVGFQTHLAFPEQQRVFSMIPALKHAEFLRFGVMHRNTYINSPRLLNGRFQSKAEPRLFFAGQFTGVEGYVESTASGLIAGINLARYLKSLSPLELPPETALGALAGYVSNEAVIDFQPMNVNFGIISPLDYRIKGKANKNLALARRSLEIIDDILAPGKTVN